MTRTQPARSRRRPVVRSPERAMTRLEALDRWTPPRPTRRPRPCQLVKDSRSRTPLENPPIS